jgi:hypothetical protein
MDIHQNLDSNELEHSLQDITLSVWTVAKECAGDTHRLLTLLRALERLHRDIREDLFEPSLPNTRNALSQLLKEIEEYGGWPYIERMRLQVLLKNLEAQEAETSEPS